MKKFLMDTKDQIQLIFFCFIFMLGFSLLIAFILGYDSSFLLYFITCLFCLFLFSLFHYLKKERWIGYFDFILTFILVVVMRIQPLISGIIQMINHFILCWNNAYQDGINFLNLSYSNEVLGLYVSLWLVVLVYSLYDYLFTYKRIYLLWIFSIVILFIYFVIDSISMLGFALMLVGLFSMWIIWLDSGRACTRVIWLSLIFATLFITVFEKNETILFIENFRHNVSSEINTLRYGKDTLPEGDLSKADSLLDGNKTTLQVKTQQVKSLYLKGFVGSNYDQGVWTSLTNQDYGYQNSGMLDWLMEHGYNAIAPLGVYNTTGEASIDTNSVVVSNVGANRKYIYTSNSVLDFDSSRIKKNKDQDYTSLTFFGTKGYSFDEISSSDPYELFLTADWINNPQTNDQNEFLQAESVYRQFVYDHYLTVPESLESTINTYFKNQYQEENDSIFTVTTFIRNQLSLYVKYSSKMEQTNDDDPILYFLTEGKQGNAVLFASTAVEAYRSFGIPARYVEGYYLSESAVSKSNDGNVALTSQDSHAWVEVYMDGVGWLPIDVTPGFYYDNASLMKLVERPNGQTTKAIEDNQYDNEASKASTPSKQKTFIDQLLSVDNLPLFIGSLVLFVLILITLVILIQEMIRTCYVLVTQRKYEKLNIEQKTRFLYCQLFGILEAIHIPASLGWNTIQTDQMICDKNDLFFFGEYKCVVSLFEKYFYGGEVLHDHDIAFIESYINRFYLRMKNLTSKEKIKILHLRVKKKDYM